MKTGPCCCELYQILSMPTGIPAIVSSHAAPVGTKGESAVPPEAALSELMSQECLVERRSQFLSSWSGLDFTWGTPIIKPQFALFRWSVSLLSSIYVPLALLSCKCVHLCRSQITHDHLQRQQNAEAVIWNLLFFPFSPNSVNKHKPWLEPTYHGITTENDNMVLVDLPPPPPHTHHCTG